MIKWTRWSNQSKKSTLFGFENYKKKWRKRPELQSMLVVYSWLSELDDQTNPKNQHYSDLKTIRKNDERDQNYSQCW